MGSRRHAGGCGTHHGELLFGARRQEKGHGAGPDLAERVIFKDDLFSGVEHGLERVLASLSRVEGSANELRKLAHKHIAP